MDEAKSMDEAKLKQILEGIEVPPMDEDARKRALALALAEFRLIEEKKHEAIQGMSFFSRLIARTTSKRRKITMEPKIQFKSKQRLIYGGLATAMVVVLVAGTVLTQTINIQFGLPGSDDLELAAQQEQRPVVTDTAVQIQQPVQTAAIPPVQKNAPLAQNPVAPQSSTSAITPQPVTGAKRQGTAQSLAESQVAPAAPQPAAPPTSQNARGSVMAKVTRPNAQTSFAAPAQESADMAAAESKAVQNYVGGGMPSPSPSMIYNQPRESVPPAYVHVDEGRDKFKDFRPNPVKMVRDEPVSTFSIDVDTASYSFMRRQLNAGIVPNADSVRVEEMVNYFDYNYPLPETKNEPFKPTVTVLDSPWSPEKKLIHIGIKGYNIASATRPHANLVFLLDTSGSMDEPDKLPLLKNSIKMLLETLDANDRVSIVAYAGAAGTVLEPTKASDKSKILSAIDNLSAGGSTAGAEGINLAYQLAEQNFDKEGVNRIILATDGDFNVGASSDEELKQIIERKRESGIFLSVIGFGQGNLNDSLMQTLAQNGNGTAAYIDNLSEANKVLVREASSTLFTIAKDVKIQVDFNPATVAEYRLVGYETRALNREDFNNDKIDAGDIGAGHTVTAIYEITPVGATPSVDPSRYAETETVKPAPSDNKFGNEYAFLKIRYKLPNEKTSKLMTTPITTSDYKELTCVCPPNAMCEPCGPAPSEDVKFAVAVAGFAQLLKGDSHIGNLTYEDIIQLAQEGKGTDEYGSRAEFITLVRLAKNMHR